MNPFSGFIVADPCGDRSTALEICARRHHEEAFGPGKWVSFFVAREGDGFENVALHVFEPQIVVGFPHVQIDLPLGIRAIESQHLCRLPLPFRGNDPTGIDPIAVGCE